MIFVGIGDAIHDTSICALIDGEFKYRKSERHLHIKHHELMIIGIIKHYTIGE